MYYLENLARDSLEIFRGPVALHVMGKLVEGHLRSGGVEHKPVCGSSNGSGTNICTNSHISRIENI